MTNKNGKALAIAENIKRIASPFKESLPHFLYVTSFSTEYYNPSKVDWCLDIVLYDTKNHQLLAVTTQFAMVNGVHTSWLPKEPNFIPFPKPRHLKVQKLGVEAWQDLELDIFDKVVYSVLKLSNEKDIVPDKHEVTGHSLVPEFTIGETR